MTTFELIRLMNRPRLLDNKTLEQIGAMHDKFPYCQCLRMLYLKNLFISDAKKFNETLENCAALVQDRAKLFQYIHGVEDRPLIPHEKSAVYSIEKLDADSALKETSIHFSYNNEYLSKDEFLRRPFYTQTGETGQYDDNFDESDDLNEEESIHNEMDFVTETLAEIFVSKRKYEDAIKTYEKLCLKYPEKSSYFAARIEKLKNNL